jgi:signal transduction histidine kinase
MVREVLGTGAPASAPPHPSLGTRGAAGITTYPLAWENNARGCLLISYPAPLAAANAQQLAQLASTASLHLDHAHVSAEVARLHAALCQTENVADEKTDELLKLSEALFAQDIELLRNNEKLGKIEKLKNDFIEKMSRELRTPLNSIIEAIIGVLAGENESISDVSKSSMRHALDEGTAFQRTLENILDLWRVKQGELPIELQEVNFAEVAEEAIFSVQDTLGDKPVTIVKEIGEPLPKFKADLAKVNQILFLLLDNSAKFTTQGTIVIRAQVEGSELLCDVIDTGIGVCSDDQEFIYGEFYQVDARTSTKYRGAGLGLTLVRDLLILLGGDITFTSEPGKGTHIAFQIPVQGRLDVDQGHVGLHHAGCNLAQRRDDRLVFLAVDEGVGALLQLLGADGGHLNQLETVGDLLGAVLDGDSSHIRSLSAAR